MDKFYPYGELHHQGFQNALFWLKELLLQQSESFNHYKLLPKKYNRNIIKLLDACIHNGYAAATSADAYALYLGDDGDLEILLANTEHRTQEVESSTATSGKATASN